jgi:hypothetical protein
MIASVENRQEPRELHGDLFIDSTSLYGSHALCSGALHQVLLEPASNQGREYVLTGSYSAVFDFLRW